MTNFEWLSKEGRATILVSDLKNLSYDRVMAKYGIPRTDKIDIATIANWLQEEHKETSVWVKLEDVLNAIVNRPFKVDSTKIWLRTSEVYKLLDENTNGLLRDVRLLDSKEIEDD